MFRKSEAEVMPYNVKRIPRLFIFTFETRDGNKGKYEAHAWHKAGAFRDFYSVHLRSQVKNVKVKRG